LKDYDLSDVSSREDFHLLSAAMHYSLYSSFFVESTTLAIVLNRSSSCLACVDCDQAQVGAILHLEEENNNNVTYLSFGT